MPTVNYIHEGLPSGLFSMLLTNEILYALLIPHACYMLISSHGT